MGFHREKVDILFTNNGDLVLDDVRGDLASTSKIPLRGLQQQIDARINSNKNDWALNPSVGADLRRFQGEPNNKETGAAIKTAIENELMRGGLLKSNEFYVKVFPVSSDSIAIFLSIRPNGEKHMYQQIYTYDLKNLKIVRSK